TGEEGRRAGDCGQTGAGGSQEGASIERHCRGSGGCERSYCGVSSKKVPSHGVSRRLSLSLKSRAPKAVQPIPPQVTCRVRTESVSPSASGVVRNDSAMS